MATTSGERAQHRQGHRHRWVPHRAWGIALRVLIALVPVAVGLAVGQRVALLLGAPVGWTATALWWTAVLSATMAAVLVVEQAARRLLPLSMLLGLSLVFPDRAPNRFRVALRASSVRRAERALDEIGEGAGADEHAEAALALVAALHAHDRRTRGHSERVRALTVMIGRELGLDQEALYRLEWAGLLHDIGKLRVPATILNKAGPPDDEEWSVLRRHPGDGGTLMAPLATWLGEWVHGVDQHHEYHDGTGYPRGLAAEDIALSGRIVAVTDALETMTAARAYKRPMPVAQARAELVACAGTQFDPVVVRAVLALSVPRLVVVLGPLAALLQVPVVAPVATAATDLHGALAVVASTTPRAVATAALVLGTLGGGPTATVAGADTQVTGIALGEHAAVPTGAGDAVAAGGGEAGGGNPAADGRGADGGGAVVGRDLPGADPHDGTGSGGGRPADDPVVSTGAAAAPGSPGPATRPPTTTPTTGPPPTAPPTTAPPPVTAPPAPHPNPPGLPAAALACFDGGWLGLGFPNQGRCISAMIHG